MAFSACLGSPVPAGEVAGCHRGGSLQPILPGSRARGFFLTTPQRAMLLRGHFHVAGSLGGLGDKCSFSRRMEGSVQNNPSCPTNKLQQHFCFCLKHCYQPVGI